MAWSSMKRELDDSGGRDGDRSKYQERSPGEGRILGSQASVKRLVLDRNSNISSLSQEGSQKIRVQMQGHGKDWSRKHEEGLFSCFGTILPVLTSTDNQANPNFPYIFKLKVLNDVCECQQGVKFSLWLLYECQHYMNSRWDSEASWLVSMTALKIAVIKRKGRAQGFHIGWVFTWKVAQICSWQKQHKVYVLKYKIILALYRLFLSGSELINKSYMTSQISIMAGNNWS